MRAKLGAEFIGTFWLVLGGCGSAVLAAAFPGLGIGFTGVSLAFGLTVLTGACLARADLGRPLQPCRVGGVVGWWPLPRRTAGSLHRRPGPRRDRSRCGALRHRNRQARLRPRRLRFCGQRLRRPLAWQLLPHCRPRHRDRHDVHVPDRDPRRDPQARARPASPASPSASH